jgi:hypothetical protein
MQNVSFALMPGCKNASPHVLGRAKHRRGMNVSPVCGMATVGHHLEVEGNNPNPGEEAAFGAVMEPPNAA